MTCNSSPCNATQIQNAAEGALVYTSSAVKNSTSLSYGYHRSFDFSNINVNSSYYKQFHQTKIYVKDFQGMTLHGSEVGGENSTYLISANLPDSFNYAIGSEWATPLSDIFKGVGNLIMQVGSDALKQSKWGLTQKIGANIRSGINRAAHFLIWNGSKPLEIQLKIPVLDDNTYQNQAGGVRTNLKEALEFLGCLCLPKKSGDLGFYEPAPSPLNINIMYKSGDKPDNVSFSPNKARIMVKIGGMLFIDNCIVKNVSVSYPNTKALMRRDDGTLSPLLAEVTISISTIEPMMSTTYTKMLWLKDQDEGQFNLDIAAIQEKAEEYTKAFNENALGKTPESNITGQETT